MSTLRIERQCVSCHGTGLYCGFAEKNGAAVVCHTCKGSGKEVIEIDNTAFTGRTERKGVKRVFQHNPGFGIGTGNNQEGRSYRLEDFGGIPYADWAAGKPFGPGTEMRQFVCPHWWFQSVDYDRKPNWPECDEMGCGSFRNCPHFENKDRCWSRYDQDGYKRKAKPHYSVKL